MGSDLQNEHRRVPQRPRGEKRYGELMEAAAAVIVEVGYEAATMTAIAERAGASIGAVYQYFPNKEAVVRALRLQYAAEMEARWVPLVTEAAELGTQELVDRIFGVIVDIITHRPAFLPLHNVPGNFRRDPAAKIRLRENFATLFRNRKPSLAPEEAFRIANVALQIVKAMHPLYADAAPDERPSVLAEFKLVLSAYLIARLGRTASAALSITEPT